MVRSVAECLHAVVWQGAVGILPAAAVRNHRADGIAYVPLTDYPASRVVLAWPAASRPASRCPRGSTTESGSSISGVHPPAPTPSAR